MTDLSSVLPGPKHQPIEALAERLGVGEQTIRRWIQAGLPAIKFGPGGKLWVRENDLVEFLKKRTAVRPDHEAAVKRTKRGGSAKRA